MGLRIVTNTSSMNAQRHLQTTTNNLSTHTERLSSGFRINKSADDAAGMAISEKLKANIRSINQAKRNALDGISMVQTAEGALNEISNITSRLRELSVQAASDTIGVSERGFLQKEFTALKDEIDRISCTSDFNGTLLLTGQTPLPPSMREKSNTFPVEFQVGYNYLSDVDNINVTNPVNIIRLDLQNINAMTDGPNSLELGSSLNPEGTHVDTKEGAQRSISKVDQAIEKINSFRASLGAIQTRLTSAISNLSIQTENMEATRSRIKDADYAEESAQVTQNTILQKAGISVLAQANQMPELALKLLQ